jgi:anti-sigma factor ChrR (cupin superfamily)
MLFFENHPTDETIELYALGRLAEHLVPSLEEHLLVCDRCQDALQAEEAFSRSIIAALRADRAGTVWSSWLDVEGQNQISPVIDVVGVSAPALPSRLA